MQQYDLILQLNKALHSYHEGIMTSADMIERCKSKQRQEKIQHFHYNVGSQRKMFVKFTVKKRTKKAAF